MEHGIKNRIFGYADLHNHLYGSLSAETLFRIGKANPNPRWQIFTEPYEKAFGKKINPATFFEDYDTVEKFAKLYYFDHRGPFPEFQAKFNLIIALVEFSILENKEVAKQIVLEQARLGVSHGEYRIMFAKDEPRPSFEARIQAACQGVAEGEALVKKENLTMEGRIAFSLHRSGMFREQYQWIKELMEKDPIVHKYLVGLDFCYVEEGFPPKDKLAFFEEVNRDNLAEPATALAILYHVGESYQDKTPFSAARWVLESAEGGAHRLGHCIALGIKPDVFLNTKRTEKFAERMDQLQWEIEHYKEISDNGEYWSLADLDKERKSLGNLSESQFHSGEIEMRFSERECNYLRTFQNTCMKRISRTDVVVESCPSSNYYIGMIHDPSEHPLPRFIDSNLRITIASDDPGIFHTNIQEEYKKAEEMGISQEVLETIRERSFDYRSELLVGRGS
jgi:adenosine deaminase